MIAISKTYYDVTGFSTDTLCSTSNTSSTYYDTCEQVEVYQLQNISYDGHCHEEEVPEEDNSRLGWHYGLKHNYKPPRIKNNYRLRARSPTY